MTLSIVGDVSYSVSGDVATVTIDRVRYDGSGRSGSVRFELWATETPYVGERIVGYRIAEYRPEGDALNSGASFLNIRFSDSFNVPNGNYYLTVLVSEYTGDSSNDGFTIEDSASFSQLLNVGGVAPNPDPGDETGGAVNYVYGTWGDDSGLSINGTNAHDVIYGYAGNDDVFSFDGDDRVYGGTGQDTLTGGYGEDTLYGDSGDDRLFGMEGKDFLYGGDGNDRILGGSGSDRIRGQNGKDYLAGMAGRDSIWGGASNDMLIGGSGADQLFGGDGRDTLYGDSGDDRLSGGRGHDNLVGFGGNDRLLGDRGNDHLSGHEGNDRLVGGMGADDLLGGTGRDTLVGGGGTDDLFGGKGQDLFIFRSLSDFAMSSKARETIFDFSRSDNDAIDLKSIDANTRVAGNQAFDFIGTRSFSEKASELRFKNGVLRGDVNGDGSADILIELLGVSRLSASDFVL